MLCFRPPFPTRSHSPKTGVDAGEVTRGQSMTPSAEAYTDTVAPGMEAFPQFLQPPWTVLRFTKNGSDGRGFDDQYHVCCINTFIRKPAGPISYDTPTRSARGHSASPRGTRVARSQRPTARSWQKTLLRMPHSAIESRRKKARTPPTA